MNSRYKLGVVTNKISPLFIPPWGTVSLEVCSCHVILEVTGARLLRAKCKDINSAALLPNKSSIVDGVKPSEDALTILAKRAIIALLVCEASDNPTPATFSAAFSCLRRKVKSNARATKADVKVEC